MAEPFNVMCFADMYTFGCQNFFQVGSGWHMWSVTLRNKVSSEAQSGFLRELCLASHFLLG